MARINGVDLPREKRVEIGLTYLYGIGRTSATKICAEVGIDPSTRVRDLNDEDIFDRANAASEEGGDALDQLQGS